MNQPSQPENAEREALAIFLLNRDEGGDALEWATKFFHGAKDFKHEGDCSLAANPAPFTCSRCVADGLLRDADAILALRLAAAPPAAGGEDWKDDPSADERWNAGVDFAMLALCGFMKVEPDSVNWDAATETVDGDVRAVIGNILRAKLGENWSPLFAQPEAGVRDIDVRIDAAYANGVRAVLTRLAHIRRPEHDRAWRDCEAMELNRRSEIHALSAVTSEKSGGGK